MVIKSLLNQQFKPIIFNALNKTFAYVREMKNNKNY